MEMKNKNYYRDDPALRYCEGLGHGMISVSALSLVGAATCLCAEYLGVGNSDMVYAAELAFSTVGLTGLVTGTILAVTSRNEIKTRRKELSDKLKEGK